MSAFFKLLLFSFLEIMFFVLIPQSTEAQSIDIKTPEGGITEKAASLQVTISGLEQGKNYLLCNDFNLDKQCKEGEFLTRDLKNGTITICGDGEKAIKINCDNQDFFHAPETYKIAIYKTTGETKVIEKSFYVGFYYPNINFLPKNPKPEDEIRLSLSGVNQPPDKWNRNNYQVTLITASGTQQQCVTVHPTGSTVVNFGKQLEGNYKIEVNEWIDDGDNPPEKANSCKGGFTYYGADVFVEKDGGSIIITKDPDHKDKLQGTTGENPCIRGVCDTALGKISTDPKAFASKILSIGAGLGGAFALILMVIGSIRVLTSSGDAKSVGAGRDMIVAAVSGLLFIILSTVILRFIGINILGL